MIYYLVGIKGSGMSALAIFLYEQGHIVKGVDQEIHYFTEDKLYNIEIESFKKMNLKKSYFYIIGNSYINSSTFNFIKSMNYRYLTYPKFIFEYLLNYNFIAVGGTHGKTTSSTMLSVLLNDYSYIIGDGSASGKSKTNIIVEACEYRDSFLNYYPDISLILNIDYDHPDYFKSKEDYLNSFKKFAYQSKLIIANGDDLNIQKIKSSRFITYGLNEENDIKFEYEINNYNMKIKILSDTFNIPYVGLQYAYDFVGSYIVCKMKGLEDRKIKERIKYLSHPKRRMEKYIKNNSIMICDYAHHPTEIKCLYESIKAMYDNIRIVCFFQPHTISRSITFIEEFKESLDLFDDTYIIRTFTSVREENNIKKEKEIYDYWGYKILSRNDVMNFKFNNNVYLFLGAGDIDKIFKNILNL